MIANISPNISSFGETQNTLHWADRAKEIRIKAPDANEDPLPVPKTEKDQAKLILGLQNENHQLRVQLARQTDAFETQSTILGCRFFPNLTNNRISSSDPQSLSCNNMPVNGLLALSKSMKIRPISRIPEYPLSTKLPSFQK